MVCHNPPSVLPPDSGVRHEIDLVPGTKYCVTRQWPLPKEQCDVIDDSFVLSTRREWCGRVSLPIPHLHFVSKSLMVSGVLCTLIISLMLPLSRLRHQSPEKRCSSEQYGGIYIVQCARLSRWLLPAAHASKRYSANSG